MATRKSQRIGIWVIAIAMMLGTIGGFAAMIIDPSGGAELEQERLEKQMKDYEKQMNEMGLARAKSSKPLKGHEATKFDPETVDSLQVEVLKEGDGPVLDASSTISADYFGWTSNGKIFDSTNQNGTVAPVQFGLGQVIKGWTDGLTGVKAGSVVMLTIPSDQAYGKAGSPPNIGPDEPLRFIVNVHEKIEE